MKVMQVMKVVLCPRKIWECGYMDVSENSGTPKSSILIGFSIINHPFWGTTIFGNTHIAFKNKGSEFVMGVSSATLLLVSGAPSYPDSKNSMPLEVANDMPLWPAIKCFTTSRRGARRPLTF